MDSNVLIYAHNNLDSVKQDKVQTLIELSIPTISTQVLNEFTNAFRKKFHVEWSVIRTLLSGISANTVLHANTLTTVLKATDIAERYGYSFYETRRFSQNTEGAIFPCHLNLPPISHLLFIRFGIWKNHIPIAINHKKRIFFLLNL